MIVFMLGWTVLMERKNLELSIARITKETLSCSTKGSHLETVHQKYQTSDTLRWDIFILKS